MQADSTYQTGSTVGSGSFICVECSFQIALEALDSVPACPTCGGSEFRRASLFEQPTLTDNPPMENDPAEPEWLQRLRASEQGQFLAFEDENGEIQTVAVPEGWTRIGRSITADIRLDDRSLNGLFVNGETVEWSQLGDGDELAIGRFHLHLVDTSMRAPSRRAPDEAITAIRARPTTSPPSQ